MADYPALPIFTDAIMADCQHLTDEEFGRYMRLLIVTWRTPGCTIPNDLNWICKRLHIDPLYAKQKVQPIIDEFFTVGTDSRRIYQKRLLKEYEYVKTTSNRQRQNAKSRWEKGKDPCQPTQVAYAPTPTPHPNEVSIKTPLPPTAVGRAVGIGFAADRVLGVFVNGGSGGVGCKDGPEHTTDVPNGIWRGSASGGTDAFRTLMAFDVEHHLTDRDRDDIINLAPGWSIQKLCAVYNQGVNNGRRTKPKYPAKAFKAWVPKYTKGRRP